MPGSTREASRCASRASRGAPACPWRARGGGAIRRPLTPLDPATGEAAGARLDAGRRRRRSPRGRGGGSPTREPERCRASMSARASPSRPRSPASRPASPWAGARSGSHSPSRTPWRASTPARGRSEHDPGWARTRGGRGGRRGCLGRELRRRHRDQARPEDRRRHRHDRGRREPPGRRRRGRPRLGERSPAHAGRRRRPGGTIRMETLEPRRSARSGTRLPVPLVVGHARLVRKAPRLRGRARGRRRATVPEPAEGMPRRSNGGRTYTFVVRRGFRFSPPSGEPVTARSMKYTIERSLHPRMRSPAADLLNQVAGEAAYAEGRARHISGIRASGDKPSITLVEPSSSFLQRIALPFFCPVPSARLSIRTDFAGFRQRVRTTWRPTYRTRRSCCVAIRTTAVRAAPVRTRPDRARRQPDEDRRRDRGRDGGLRAHPRGPRGRGACRSGTEVPRRRAGSRGTSSSR